jgi:hypothetical protein
LTDEFVRNHFSLRTLLTSIATHPLYNLAPPGADCWAKPYEIPRILDPWTNTAADEAERLNGPGDRVHAISTRTLRRDLHRAMGWPYFHDFPETEQEEQVHAAIGLFLQISQPGFRGLDFQGRMVWESEYGACEPQGDNDFIDQLVAAAKGTPSATAGDAAVVLKDRLLGEPFLASDEVAETEAVLGVSLGTGADDPKLEPGLRYLCGVYAASPLFLLGGLADDELDVEPPRIVLPDQTYRAACEELAGLLALSGAGFIVSCEDADLTITQ